MKIAATIFLFLCVFLKSYCQDRKDTIYKVRNDSLRCDISDDVKNNPTMVFTKVENQPVYPGGQKAWDAFVKENFQSEKGELYIINVMFIVELDGSLTKFQFPGSRNQSEKFETFVIDKIKNGGPWFPARQNGICVRAWHLIRIPINVFYK